MTLYRNLRRTAALVLCALSFQASAQETKIKFTLDWRFEGPSALFLVAKQKGYFAQEKLDVTIDSGSGSGNAVNRVASGAYEMGFADLAVLMEFVGNNPTAPNKPVGVMMVYNDTPASIFTLKKSGITKPSDLIGKKMGGPVFDASRRAFPIFAKSANLDNSKINWVTMEPALRETMLAKGDVDAIAGFYFTCMLSLNARGVKEEDVNVMTFPEHGVKMYSNAIIASDALIKQNPEAVKGFLRAFAKASRDVMADPAKAIKAVKERDGLINEDIELRRLKMALSKAIVTPNAKAEGYGAVSPARLALMSSQVSDAYGTKTRIDPNTIWNSSLLPSKAELNVWPK
jgi:NitT/TauT family transport system substrate-binding protein